MDLYFGFCARAKSFNKWELDKLDGIVWCEGERWEVPQMQIIQDVVQSLRSPITKCVLLWGSEKVSNLKLLVKEELAIYVNNYKQPL